jgi:hypothetical protein
MITDMTGRIIQPGDVVYWLIGSNDAPQLTSGAALRYGDFENHNALWVHLPNGLEGPLLAKDGPYLLSAPAWAEPSINKISVQVRLTQALRAALNTQEPPQ